MRVPAICDAVDIWMYPLDASREETGRMGSDEGEDEVGEGDNGLGVDGAIL